MTLNEFADMTFSVGGKPVTFIVFDNEECIEGYIEENDDGGIAFTFSGHYKSCVFLNSKMDNARVVYFYAIACDKIAVLIEQEE